VTQKLSVTTNGVTLTRRCRPTTSTDTDQSVKCDLVHAERR